MLKLIKKIFNSNSDESILKNQIKLIFKEIPIDFGGGCSFKKALLLSSLIKEFNITNSIDLGVYRGRSFFPQVIAHHFFTNGIAYGIDPYSSKDAIQNDREDLREKLDDFVNTTNFEAIYQDLLKKIEEKEWSKNSKIIRKRSDLAFDFFENCRVGLIHIDGNHDTNYVLKDVENYFSVLYEKGFIILDDITWDSVKPAYNILKSNMDFIGEIVDDFNDFALFVKKDSLEEYNKGLQLLNYIKNQ